MAFRERSQTQRREELRDPRFFFGGEFRRLQTLPESRVLFAADLAAIIEASTSSRTVRI